MFDLQCWISLCHTAVIQLYTHTHTRTHNYIYSFFFFIFFSVMVYCRILNIVPCAVQQDLVFHLFYVQQFVSQVAQWLRIYLLMQESWVWSLGGEDPLEKEMATHSSMLAWEIPWQRNLVGCSPWGHDRVGLGLVTK